MRISDWSSDVCSSDLRACRSTRRRSGCADGAIQDHGAADRRRCRSSSRRHPHARSAARGSRLVSLLDSGELVWRARDIRCLFLDIDGVLTDGKLYIGPNGEETKTSYVRDGLGIKMMLKAGLHVAVNSGRPSEAMRTRLSWPGVQHIAPDTEDKAPASVRLRDALGPKDAHCAHMADDVPHTPLLQRRARAITAPP